MLLPPRLAIAGATLGDVDLFPLRDGLGFVVAHLVVHARAALERDLFLGVSFVVLHALVDSFHVVRGRGERCLARQEATKDGYRNSRVSHVS
jgi:hypothetical protein